jgi:hypothetical protein
VVAVKTFLTRPGWSFADRLAALALVLVVAWSSTGLIFPASQWIQVDRVHVFDTVEGVDPAIEVDRRLYRGTPYGRYVVVVRDAMTHHAECTARRAVPYVQAAAASPIRGRKLRWWAYSTDGECRRWPVPVGRYYTETMHCWRAFWWAREACSAWVPSNIFTVRAPPP